MGAFQFKNYDLTVDIAGFKFTFRCDTEMGDNMAKFESEANSLAALVGKGEKTPEDVVRFSVRVIDSVLGDGAAEKIFAGRPRSVSDYTDVILFLAEEITTFMRKAKQTARPGAPRMTKK